MTVYSHTRPAIGIAGYSFWWLGTVEDEVASYRVRRCWQHGRRILAELEGVTDREAAQALCGKRIWVAAADVELGPNEYLWQDLIGCELCDESSGHVLGTVIALEEYGAQDILTVQTPDDVAEPGVWLLPFVAGVIVDVDLARRLIVARLPEGMDACFTPRS